MNEHIDPNDRRCAEVASEILRRHRNGEAEANITSAVRDFLIATNWVTGTSAKAELSRHIPRPPGAG